MQFFTCILLGFLVVCAISVSLSKNLLNSLLIYMSYSLVMSIIWILLESPDLAITEAAVGAGVTSILFFVTLKKIHAIADEDGEEAEQPITTEDGNEVEEPFTAEAVGIAEAGNRPAVENIAVETSDNALSDKDTGKEIILTVDGCSTEADMAAKQKKAKGGGKNEQKTL